MALKGTLKDFGIADILQLIGQQQKTGTLTLTNKGDTVNVVFKDGNIIRAEMASRNKRDLIGTMLVRAGLITEQQLDFALETQKRTLQRLGDVLVTQGTVTSDKFKEMVQLQTSETLFRLFMWKAGNYAFEQQEIEVDASIVPLRAESVLMEGFRRVDEWPVVKKRITTYHMSFERKKELPPPPMKKDDFDSALDDAFSEEKKEINKGEFQSVGEAERKVYNFVTSGRTVQKIIDLSMLGEFETCKALCNLINLDYIAQLPMVGKPPSDERPDESRFAGVLGMMGRVVVTMVVIATLLFVGTRVDLGVLKVGSNATTYTDPAAQRFASQQQMSRIGAALEVYRLENGEFPGALSELVDSQILGIEDLRYPWREDYFYRRANETGTYVLLPPLR